MDHIKELQVKPSLPYSLCQNDVFSVSESKSRVHARLDHYPGKVGNCHPAAPSQEMCITVTELESGYVYLV